MSSLAFDFGFGAQLQEDGSTRFRLWAPDCTALTLELGDGRAMPMHAVEDGWFELVADASAGTQYRYRLNRPDGDVVPDIGSRAQFGGVHGWSVVVDPRKYDWKTADWKGRPWHEAIIEEVHVGLLDGYDGVRKKLPYFVETGVTAIELMPIAEFPGTRNWGYDGVMPFAPDAVYGPPNALKRLIDEAHELGLMVLLDVVYNHFGPDGNYLGKYASGFFRKDVPTPWGDAIDMKKKPVSNFFIANALYWLNEYRFDGLRFDAVHAIIDQGWLVDLATRVRTNTDGRHTHLVLEHDGNAAGLLTHGFDAQWNDDFHHVMHTLVTGERGGYYAEYADKPIEMLARAWREGFIWQGEASPYRDGAKRGEPSAHLPPTKFVAFLQNHDQIGNRAFGERMTALTPPERNHAALAFLLLSPFVPLLFMGEEYGETIPFLYFTAYEDGLATAVRDGRRKEFAKFPEFSDASRRARIPDPNESATFTSSRPRFPAQSPVREQVRKLIALRKREIVPWLDRKSERGADVLSDRALCATWRREDGRTLYVCVNFGDEEIAVPHLQDSLLYATSAAVGNGRLQPASLVAWLG